MSLTLDGSSGAYVVRATVWEGHLPPRSGEVMPALSSI